MSRLTLLSACVGELVLLDSTGEFLLVHGSDEYLSLARRPDEKGEVPIVRFALAHAPVLAAAMEVVLAEPVMGALSASVGSDALRVEACGGLRVANLSRRRPGSRDPEALELDRAVAVATIEALRGPRLAPLGDVRRGMLLEEASGHAAAVESVEGRTVVSSRTQRTWARASFAASLRRVVAACLAMVVGNPGETAIRVAHVARGDDDVLLERSGTAVGTFPFVVANARPGRPAPSRRLVRLSQEMASWVVRCLARDEDLAALARGPA